MRTPRHFSRLLALIVLSLTGTAVANDESAETSAIVESDDDKPWGQAIGATLAVNLCTLIGVAFVLLSVVFSSIAKGSRDIHWLLYICLPSFAAGALLSTAVFLILPEALHHLEGEGENAEAQQAWKLGACVLGGYLFPIVLGAFFDHEEDGYQSPHTASHTVIDEEPDDGNTEKGHKEGETDEVCVDEGGDLENTAEHNNHETAVVSHEVPTSTKARAPNYRLATSILVGDFVHNFADGIFIGNAFMLCDSRFAWLVTFSTIFHELSQELSDFFLLVNQCGLSPFWALVLNFVSGLSVMFGAIVILATDVSSVATGSILAISAGVYIYISAGQCQPRVEKEISCKKDRMLSVLFFVLGCIPIGLVLLDHKHCEVHHDELHHDEGHEH